MPAEFNAFNAFPTIKPAFIGFQKNARIGSRRTWPGTTPKFRRTYPGLDGIGIVLPDDKIVAGAKQAGGATYSLEVELDAVAHAAGSGRADIRRW
ncbi:hypothetical protein GALL_285610 [mine drainage metagenome]|uniref:Uncharacterized protein n=1 Tax=mine drainage metagenome TaxID=410659 RepID=A0A1J5RBY7_9ZZZZ